MTEAQILVIANVISFIGNAFFTLSSLFRHKRKIIALQTSSHLLNSIAELLQQAYSGMVQDAVMVFRNVVLLFVEDSKKVLKLGINVFCILAGFIGGIVITFIVGQQNLWYAYLPIVGYAVYSICSTLVFAKENYSATKTEVILKSAMAFYGIMQCIYGIFVKLYPLTIFSSITIFISVISLARIAYMVSKENKEKTIE